MAEEILAGTATPAESARSAQAWLRKETALAHQAAEAAVMQSLLPVSQARFAEYLRRVLALYEPLEAVLWSEPGLSQWVPDRALRRKVPWLLEDLEALGIARPARSTVALAGSSEPLALLGAAYVVEGSTLGGPVLLARLREAGLFERTRAGTRFLSGYGPRTGAMWHAFRTQLQRAACSTANWSALRDGALAMFRSYSNAISQAGVR